MIKAAFTLALAFCLAAPVAAGGFDQSVSAQLRPGWRLPDGRHVAGLELTLAPGWKTYWRAPGDAGIPPSFDWSGSDNVSAVAITWPVPHVSYQGGMRSVVYTDRVVLPLTVSPSKSGEVRLSGEVSIGVCKDVCLPKTLRLDATLGDGDRPDPVIAAALADRPFSASEAGVRGVTCSVAQIEGGLSLTAKIDMPSAGGTEEMVIETGNPAVWVSEPESRRDNGLLVATAELMHMEAKPFALDRDEVTVTVIGERHVVEITGCKG
ncbi:protein-disulfide reductase DsbD domain-containing protein [Litorisediminicola beolgyonensis]|uniref:Protein-disulfide reductase DsbD domain-containing protein n=1 Tax=Litorisediminicola beolgyonensis TaxID=1173614 RepID=A0ABW3ZMZ3_9RHOB